MPFGTKLYWQSAKKSNFFPFGCQTGLCAKNHAPSSLLLYTNGLIQKFTEIFINVSHTNKRHSHEVNAIRELSFFSRRGGVWL